MKLHALLLLFVCAALSPALAQGLSPLDAISSLLPGAEAAPEPQDSEAPAPVFPIAAAPEGRAGVASLLFTQWERQAIANAIRQRDVRITDIAPGDHGDGRPDPNGPGPEVIEALVPEPQPPPEPGPRELHLGSLVYIADDDWIVWLNDTEIRPGDIPERAIAMEVTRDHVDIQWFDPYTNQIFPVRLRPGQRFNMDMRLFMPGV